MIYRVIASKTTLVPGDTHHFDGRTWTVESTLASGNYLLRREA